MSVTWRSVFITLMMNIIMILLMMVGSLSPLSVVVGLYVCLQIRECCTIGVMKKTLTIQKDKKKQTAEEENTCVNVF